MGRKERYDEGSDGSEGWTVSDGMRSIVYGTGVLLQNKHCSLKLRCS